MPRKKSSPSNRTNTNIKTVWLPKALTPEDREEVLAIDSNMNTDTLLRFTGLLMSQITIVKNRKSSKPSHYMYVSLPEPSYEGFTFGCGLFAKTPRLFVALVLFRHDQARSEADSLIETADDSLDFG